MNTHIYIHTYTHAYTIHTYIPAGQRQPCIYTYIHAHTQAYIPRQVYMGQADGHTGRQSASLAVTETHTHIRTYIQASIHTYIHTHAGIHTYTHTYTHAHTHKLICIHTHMQ